MYLGKRFILAMNKEKGLFSFIKLEKIDKDKREKLAIGFLLGVFFLLVADPLTDISQKTKKNNDSSSVVSNTEEKKETNNAYLSYLENKLEQTIGGMEGAGRVLVMITLKDGGEKILDKNRPYESMSESDKEDGREVNRENIKSDQETVLVEKDGDTSPIVIKEQYPEIEGVVVLCEGGDDKNLAVKIKEAVAALFSVPTHKIVVGKIRS